MTSLQAADGVPYVDRLLNLSDLLARKSHFLFGPRQTGKSTLVLRQLAGARVYDLLDSTTYLALSRSPERIAQELAPGDRVVVIDEIQRLPTLLHEVHRLIEQRGVRFLLTGSSARTLRRGGVNLLGGRARTKYLHPLTSRELGPRFDLEIAIARGLLPSIYFSDDAAADLQAYAGAYLQEEIVAEGATRNVPAFSRFLKVAALCNGSIVNFTNVANDAQVARTTVYEYPAFETYLMHELLSFRDFASGQVLSYWRSTSGFEVDFLIEDHTAIEVKAKPNVSMRDLRSLVALAEEARLKRYLCVSLEPRARRVGAVTILPFRHFLDALWSGEYV
ncbi:MAG: ATP-binding protein [Acidobacteria bacterium]|nr:ATP-binding protein [Acidobacteriota bacterium]